MAYLWVKVVHVLAVIAWMAGMLYLPRLFVYHASVPAESSSSETFKVMERRLLRAIMTPALLVVWASGLWLAVSGQFFTSGWLHAKLFLVLLMSGLHGYCVVLTRQFAENRNVRTPTYYRVFNELPTVLLIAIVILVVVKPF